MQLKQVHMQKQEHRNFQAVVVHTVILVLLYVAVLRDI